MRLAKPKAFIQKAKDNFLHMTIKTEMLIAFVIFALIPLGVLNLHYSNCLNDFIEERVVSYGQETVKQAGAKLDFIISQINIAEVQIAEHVVGSRLFSRQKELSSVETVELRQRTTDLLNNLTWSFPFISAIYVLNWDGQYYTTGQSFRFDRDKLFQKPWIREVVKRPASGLVVPTHPVDYNSILQRPAISFVKNIDSFGRRELNTIVQLDIDCEFLREIIKDVNIGEDGFLVVVDGNDRILVGSGDPTMPGQTLSSIGSTGLGQEVGASSLELTDARGRIAIRERLRNVNWSIIGVIRTVPLLKEFEGTRRVSVALTLVVIVFSMLFSYFLSKGLTRPITDVIGVMGKVGAGNFDLRIPDTKNKDLQILTASFNRMIDQINILMKDLLDKEKEKTLAELKALEARINPHFLYNTLEVIRGIAISQDIDPIVDISESMATLFRYSISRDRDIVTLREEIESTRDYVRIQRYRYEDRFSVGYKIDERLYNNKILKLIIQPIVENAFYHGIELILGKGCIDIEASEDAGAVTVKIVDNGVGMDRDTLESIREKLRGSNGSPAGKTRGIGIGLLNVHRRIQLYYGSSYGLRLESKKERGTTVTIRVPLTK